MLNERGAAISMVIIALFLTSLLVPACNASAYELLGPRVDELIFATITSGDAQILALKKGEIHLVGWYVPPTLVPDVLSDPKLRVSIVESLAIYYLG